MDEILQHEKETVKRLVQGDESAFCELYADYKETVTRFSKRMLKSGKMAEDVFQDAFTVIWQSRKFINPELPFSTYLFTIVRNRILNILREEDNSHKIQADLLAKFNEHANITHDTILFNDLLSLVTKAKEGLTPKQLEVYELSREKNLTHAQIAEQLNISKNTVREHITMALKHIRNYLTKNSNFPDLFLMLLLLNL